MSVSPSSCGVFVVAGGGPTALQGLGDAALHGGSDVAVDAADAAEAVAEASCLGDLGMPSSMSQVL